FGNAWRRSPFEDIAFELRDASGNDIPVLVQYSGNGGAAFKLGDFSLNNILDAPDWVALRNHLTSDVSAMSPLAAYFSGDLNHDGQVDRLDFRQFKNLFNAANGPNSFEAMVGVPEPATCALMAVVGTCLVALRRAGRRACRAGAVFAVAAAAMTTPSAY